MRNASGMTYRFTAVTGVIVAAVGLILLSTHTLEWLRPVGGFLAVLGALLVVVSLVRLRRPRA